MEPSNNLSKNLKAYQNALGMSQKEFAAHLNVPRSTIQSVMSNNGNTTVDTLIRLSVSLPFSLDDLVFGDISGEAKEEAVCLSETPKHDADPDPTEQGLFHGLLSKLYKLKNERRLHTFNDL